MQFQRDSSSFDKGLTASLEGSEKVIGKILAFKKGKYNILKRAARTAAKPLVMAVRTTIQNEVGEKKGLKRKPKKNRFLAILQKKSKRLAKPVAKEAVRWSKKIAKQSKKLLKVVANDARAFGREVLREVGFKPRRRKRTTGELVAKERKTKKAKSARPRKKLKKVKPKEYTLNQISHMIENEKDRDILREIIRDRNLLGTGRFKKHGLVREIGRTGMLAKSINFKVSMAKPKRYAYDRTTGELIGGTGFDAGKLSKNSSAWVNPIWKTVSADRVIAMVGATKKPMVVWNPFVNRLQKIDPKRYLHLIEKGHVLKIRGRTRGKVKGYRVLGKTWEAKRAATLALLRSALSTELKKEMAKVSARKAGRGG